MENELWIKMTPKTVNTEPDDLTGLFLFEGQDFSHTEDQQDDDSNAYWIVIDLAERDDTTADQEQWLNTNSRVLEWTIR